MKCLFFFSLLAISLSPIHAQSKRSKPVEGSSVAYFPPRGEWEHRRAAALGLDSAQLAEAIRYARENESKTPRDQELAQAESFGKNEPFDEPVGPLKDRGDQTGIILYKGYIVAEWGEPQRVDMTNSVTKSFLSTVVGLAVDQGLIRSVTDTVAAYIPPIEVYNPAAPPRTAAYVSPLPPAPLSRGAFARRWRGSGAPRRRWRLGYYR